jgi:hypothetical protein
LQQVLCDFIKILSLEICEEWEQGNNYQ